MSKERIGDVGEWGRTRRMLWGWKPTEPEPLRRPMVFVQQEKEDRRWYNITLECYLDVNGKAWWGWSMWRNAFYWPERMGGHLYSEWDVALARALSEGGLR